MTADLEGSARRHSWRSVVWPVTAIVFAAIVTYANAVGHPFVFDDGGAIVDNPTIRALGSSLRGGLAQMPTAGRPLANLSFALNYLSGGVSPWGYHAVNLVLHVACALLVFAVLRRLLASPQLARWSAGRETGMATAVALLWTVHPLNSEIVNYATQRTEVLMALAFLGTLYCSVRALSATRPTPWSIASVGMCAAGMLCKESMAMAPLVVLLLDAAFASGGLRIALRRRPLYYAALFGTLVVLALVLFDGPRWRSAGFTSGISPWTYLLDQAPMVVHYLRLVVWPTGLVLDYGEAGPQTLAAVWAQALLVLLLLAGSVAMWAAAPALGFFAAWFFVTLAPTSSFVPIVTEVGAERRMYLPLVAVLTLLVIGATQLLDRLSSAAVPQTVGRALLGSAIVVLCGLTIGRNREYRTGLGIWQTVVERRPQGRAHYNLGLELKKVGRRADAIREYQVAAPTHPEALYALGFELDADGQHAAAVDQYRTFIARKPLDVNVPRAYHQVGRAMMTLGRYDDAMVAFREVLARKAGDADALAGLADSLLAAERWSDAVTAYTQFLSRNPNDSNARLNMGLALVRLDRDPEARDAFAAVVQQQPDNVAAHVNLAFALANTGRLGDAGREFRRAAELETDPAARADIEGAIRQLLGAH